MTATIEVERHRKGNPPVPEWLRDDYQTAWRKLDQLALATLGKTTDPETLQSTLAVLAIAHGDLKLGALIIHLDSSELDEILEQYLMWNKLYEEAAKLVPQFEITPKAFANFSPGLERQRQPWDQNI